jgi:hypothetical protein
LDAPKDSDLARALENLLNLLGILRSLEIAIQVRHGQTQINPRVLETLDDAVLRCEDIIGDLQAEKQRNTKGETEHTGQVEREHRAWQALGSRMADESSHLLISLQQILTIEGHQTEDGSRQTVEMIEDSLRLFSAGERGSDISKTLTTPQLPSVFLMQPIQLTERPKDATSSSVSESGSAIGELVQLFLDDKPGKIFRPEIIFRKPSESLPDFRDSTTRWMRLHFIKFLSNLEREPRIMDDVQSLLFFLRSNIELIVREFETRLARERAGTQINIPDGINQIPDVASDTQSTPSEVDGHSESNQSIDLGLDQYFLSTIRLHRDFIRESNAFQQLRQDVDEFYLTVSCQPTSNPRGRELFESLTSFYLTLSSTFGHFFGHSHSYRRILGVLSHVGLLEPHIPPGYVRFRWKNVSFSRFHKNSRFY